jgi:hypothetical protein
MAMAMAETTEIAALADHVLLHVLRELDLPGLASALLVCRAWRDLCGSHELWERLYQVGTSCPNQGKDVAVPCSERARQQAASRPGPCFGSACLRPTHSLPRLQRHYGEPDARAYSVCSSNMMGASAVRLAASVGELPLQELAPVDWRAMAKARRQVERNWREGRCARGCSCCGGHRQRAGCPRLAAPCAAHPPPARAGPPAAASCRATATSSAACSWRGRCWSAPAAVP